MKLLLVPVPLPFFITTTGLSDGDRDYFVNGLIPRFSRETSCFVVDPVHDECQSAHDLLVTIADNLNCKQIDVQQLSKNKGTAPGYTQSTDTIRDTPLKAISNILSSRSSNGTSLRGPKAQSVQPLIVVLRYCETISMHIINNLITLLSGPKVGFEVFFVAFTDLLCPLPVQLSSAAQALVQASVHTTVNPLDLYDALCCSLYDGREIPVALGSWLVESIHTPFAEGELCLTSAVDRYGLTCFVLFCFNFHRYSF